MDSQRSGSYAKGRRVPEASQDQALASGSSEDITWSIHWYVSSGDAFLNRVQHRLQLLVHGNRDPLALAARLLAVQAQSCRLPVGAGGLGDGSPRRGTRPPPAPSLPP